MRSNWSARRSMREKRHHLSKMIAQDQTEAKISPSMTSLTMMSARRNSPQRLKSMGMASTVVSVITCWVATGSIQCLSVLSALTQGAAHEAQLNAGGSVPVCAPLHLMCAPELRLKLVFQLCHYRGVNRKSGRPLKRLASRCDSPNTIANQIGQQHICSFFGFGRAHQRRQCIAH